MSLVGHTSKIYYPQIANKTGKDLTRTKTNYPMMFTPKPSDNTQVLKTRTAKRFTRETYLKLIG